MSTTATFGLQMSIWNSSLGTPAYSLISKLLSCQPPNLVADSPIDDTTHDSASGIREMIPAGTLKWTDCTGEFNEIVADPGQLFLATSVGTIQKFKIVKPSVPGVPVFFNAVVVEVIDSDEPLNGKATRKFKLTPTGVAPGS